MGIKDILKDIFSLGASELLGNVKKQVRDTMDEAEARIGKVMRNFVRVIVVLFMVFIGGIFALVGLSRYLETLPSINSGVGYIIVGGALFLLAIFAFIMQKE